MNLILKLKHIADMLEDMLKQSPLQPEQPTEEWEQLLDSVYSSADMYLPDEYWNDNLKATESELLELTLMHIYGRMYEEMVGYDLYEDWKESGIEYNVNLIRFDTLAMFYYQTEKLDIAVEPLDGVLARFYTWKVINAHTGKVKYSYAKKYARRLCPKLTNEEAQAEAIAVIAEHIKK